MKSLLNQLSTVANKVLYSFEIDVNDIIFDDMVAIIDYEDDENKINYDLVVKLLSYLLEIEKHFDKRLLEN